MDKTSTEFPDIGFNVACIHIANAYVRNWLPSPNAPDSLAGINDCIKRGTLLISDAYSELTIFDDAEVNWAFRAWHDWCHWRGQYPFTAAGERRTALLQIQDLHELGLATREREQILLAEVIGQQAHYEQHGVYPIDQRAFDLAWIIDPVRALATKW